MSQESFFGRSIGLDSAHARLTELVAEGVLYEAVRVGADGVSVPAEVNDLRIVSLPKGGCGILTPSVVSAGSHMS